MEASVESSMSPVGLGVDLSIRISGWGCRWGSPESYPSLQLPFSGRGIAHPYNTHFERNVQRSMISEEWVRRLAMHAVIHGRMHRSPWYIHLVQYVAATYRVVAQ